MPKRKRSQWTSWICGWWIVCTLSLWATARAADSIHDADSIRLYESSRQMYDQLEILHNQQKQQAAQKLDSIYQLQEKNRLIQQQQEEIRFSNERLWYIGIGLVLLLIFTSWLIVQQVQIRKKNRFLVQKIQESLTIRQQLFETQQQIQALQGQMETNPQPPTKPTEAIVSTEEMTRDRQLFLQIERFGRETFFAAHLNAGRSDASLPAQQIALSAPPPSADGWQSERLAQPTQVGLLHPFDAGVSPIHH